MKIILFHLLCCLGFSLNLFSQTKQFANEHSILFYNTENLFDTENDSLTNDDEFTKAGDRHWSKTRLLSKVDRISKVILAAGKWNAPILVGLCEIEGLDVLQELCRSETIKKFNYKIVQKDSRDSRGIDVALLYRANYFQPFDFKSIPVIDPSDKEFKTRDILQVSGVVAGCDTIHLFINHWPSRYGGMMESKKRRLLAARIFKNAVNEIQKNYAKAKIIGMGDFNDTPDDESLAVVLNAQHPAGTNESASGKLLNLSCEWKQEEIQTIKNKFRWEIFDQFIVSDFFMNGEICFRIVKAEIIKDRFLLEPDMAYGGLRPKRTFIGYNYHGGFSDHLPIVLRLKLQDY